MKRKILVTAGLLALGGSLTAQAASRELLNVSYDPTRELYQAYNSYFSDYWEEKTGDSVTIRQSHGGSGSQARAVIDGLAADVVTLAVPFDVDKIASRTGRISKDWQSELPDNSSPYTTVQIFLVREGNPKNISDWDDLVREDVDVITPNPKTSGGARWNFLAAYGYALDRALDGELSRVRESPESPRVKQAHEQARRFVGKLYKNVPVLDSGARGSTTTFVRRGIGDVLITYENEALLSLDKFGRDRFDIVVPPTSIRVEPPVAVVDQTAAKHGTTEVATAYLEQLWSRKAQEIAAENFYRPRNEAVLEQYADQYANLETFTVNEVYGSWTEAQRTYFNDGGVFDQIYQPGS